MRDIELHSSDGRYSAYLSAGGRRLVAAFGRCGEDAPELSPRFEATGLSCRTCYGELTDMPPVLWLLADRLKRKRLRSAYRRRCLARRRRR